MPLILTADAKSELPEALRESAKQDGAKFVVTTLPDGWEIRDTAALVRSLSNAKEERRAALAELAALKTATEGFDDPATELPAARKALEDVKAGRIKSNDQVETFRKQLEEKVAAAEKRAADAELRERTRTTEMEVLAAMSAEGMQAKFRPIVEKMIRWEKNGDGREHRVFVSDEGKVLLDMATGNPMDVRQAVSSLRKGFPEAFDIKSPGGAGTHGALGSAGAHGTQKLDPNMTPSAAFAAAARS